MMRIWWSPSTSCWMVRPPNTFVSRSFLKQLRCGRKNLCSIKFSKNPKEIEHDNRKTTHLKMYLLLNMVIFRCPTKSFSDSTVLLKPPEKLVRRMFGPTMVFGASSTSEWLAGWLIHNHVYGHYMWDMQKKSGFIPSFRLSTSQLRFALQTLGGNFTS